MRNRESPMRPLCNSFGKRTLTPSRTDDLHRICDGDVFEPDELDRLAHLAGNILANVATESVRVFVGIKVAPDIAEELARLVKPLERLPVRLIPPAYIHLTLVPPWEETDVPGATEKLCKAIRGLRACTLTFAH